MSFFTPIFLPTWPDAMRFGYGRKMWVKNEMREGVTVESPLRTKKINQSNCSRLQPLIFRFYPRSSASIRGHSCHFGDSFTGSLTALNTLLNQGQQAVVQQPHLLGFERVVAQQQRLHVEHFNGPL